MTVIFAVLIIIASIILGLIVLIQNPKGGGLSSSFGGFGNQLMGVKQTTDVLEKGTWLFAAIIGALCLVSPAFIKSSTNTINLKDTNKGTPQNTTAPATTPTQTPTVPK